MNIECDCKYRKILLIIFSVKLNISGLALATFLHVCAKFVFWTKILLALLTNDKKLNRRQNKHKKYNILIDKIKI